MREADAQLVLLVKAFEEADEEGVLLSARDRARATSQARAELGLDGESGGREQAIPADAPGGRDGARQPDGARQTVAPDPLDDPRRAGELLVTRATALLPILERQVPQLEGVLSASRLGAGLAPLLVVLAAIVGLATNALGPHGRINILFAPMLGLVLWNFTVYLVLSWIALRGLLPSRRAQREPRGATRMADAADRGARDAGDVGGAGGGRSRSDRSRSPGAGALGAVRRVGGFVGRWAGWLVERALSRAKVRQVRHQALIGAALTRYAGAWRRAAVPLISARLHLLLHLGALVLVAATVAGMYVRGLGLEYRASWESTFLNAPSVDRLLSIVLGPAAALLGWHLPSVAPFRHPASDGAAFWIHLYAMTGLIFIVLPRGVLACLAAAKVRRLSRHLALCLDDGWFRRLLAPSRGGSARVDVLPYALRVEPRGSERLAALLHDLFGSRAEIVIQGPLAYGEDPPELPPSAAAQRCRVLLFGLAASPEAEVQGRLAAELRDGLRSGESLLVLVDGSGYARRVGAGSRRLAERARAWERVLKEVGLSPVMVDLAAEPEPSLLEALAHGLYPPSLLESA